MGQIIIKAEDLSKQYRIGVGGTSYGSLRESLTNALTAPFKKSSKWQTADHKRDTVWALKNVSFELKQGEVLGIIGRNGAGKSTLLKILSRITKPTSGRALVRGRVGSLLEVGTGFHPELAGRENIYLNGSILGMNRVEIERKLDEIVEFAEIDQFLDTPVKYYSSGMYMRLAFSVAAHLETEILLVDEVLAVGDSAFQKKCLGKMDNVSKQGRTVLFVSHNMAAVQQLCNTGVVLDSGQVSFVGDVANAVKIYTQASQLQQNQNLAERTDRSGSQWLKFTKVMLCDKDGKNLQQILSGDDLFIRLYYISSKELQGATVNVAFNVRSDQGYLLTNLNSVDTKSEIMDIHRSGFFLCQWPQFNLRSGSYECALFCSINGEIVDWLQSAFTISVEDGDFFNSGKLISRNQGDILVNYYWSSHSI